MHKAFIALAVSLLAMGFAGASTQTDVMSVVHQWADGFNNADVKLIAARCADQASVVDDFPPHEWHGAAACSQWFNDFRAFAKQAAITDAVIAVGKPGHVDVTGDVVYVVAPTTLAYRARGKPANLNGIITVILRKSSADWRITSLTWADL